MGCSNCDTFYHGGKLGTNTLFLGRVRKGELDVMMTPIKPTGFFFFFFLEVGSSFFGAFAPFFALYNMITAFMF